MPWRVGIGYLDEDIQANTTLKLILVNVAFYL